MRKFILLLSILTLISASNAFALKFEYDTVLTGDMPGGTTPWLVAEFTQTLSDRVSLQLTANNVTSTEFVSKWYFNFSGDMPLTFSPIVTSGTELKSYEFNIDHVEAPTINSGFDLSFEFKTSNGARFGNTDVATITINGAGITPEMFNVGTEDNEDLLSVAHIQGIGTNAAGSAWVWPDGNGEIIETVPEPGTLLLLGMGLTGLVWCRRRK